MNENILAKSLLEKRDNGVSVLSGLKSIKIRVVLRFFFLGALYAISTVSENEPLFYLGIGFVLGMTIQDIGWLSSIAKSWPFSNKVTDWSKVEELANKNS